jgi:Cu(I)/Ag(I) efflux system membrane fusion protein
MRKNWRNKLKIKIGEWRMENLKFSILNFQFSMLLMIILSACTNNKHAEHSDTYICPMHPTVISDRPSTCPVCGMDLVRKARPGEEVEITPELARLLKSPNEIIVANIKTIKGEFKSMPVTVQGQGIVTYDTRTNYSIPARIGGRLEKVYIKYPFQSIRKGQKVADIYSPELLTAQRELLYVLENDGSNTAMIEATENKLYLLGATQVQVNEVISKKEIQSRFSIYSPYDGYVIGESQQAPTLPTTPSASSGMGGSMGGTTSSPAPQQPMNTSSEFVREGTYVTTGQVLFKVVNASALRIELNLPASQGKQITTGTAVDLHFDTETTQQGKVDFIQPFFSEGEEFVTVRVYTKSSSLQIGQLVQATINAKQVEALWVPKGAVLDLGSEKIVFIKDREVFKPKTITTGIESNGWIEIIQGLSSSDEIAINAQYLVDSESFIKTK